MTRPRIYADDNARKRASKQRLRTNDAAIERWRNRPFIAIDGEGKDDNEQNHHYTMLTVATQEWHKEIFCDSLDTEACFRFLLGLHKQNANAIFVGFSINYDINMMLKDIPIENLRELNKEGYTQWLRYGISWIPGKIFRISLYQKRRKGAVQTITIYDVFGFFQSSFVSTLKAWGIGTPEQVTHLTRMKKQRGNFADVDDKAIHEYNTLECVLLVELMEALRKALDAAGLYLQSWHGAGAVSGQLLKINRIHEHVERPTYPALNDAIMRAYFGGRFETKLLGISPVCWSHDLKSAYPSAFLNLPTLKGEWKHVTTYDESAEWSVWRVRWALSPTNTINPFPYRSKRRISYPYAGEGYYWQPEVMAARRHYNIEVLEGYVFLPYSGAKPFAFLSHAYAARKHFADKGNSAEKVLKLGINGVYGKTAQGTRRNGNTPKFQSFVWAGYCTSVCRARVFALAMRKPDSVIAFATDGVFATERLTTPADEGNDLGQWEVGEAGYMFWIQSGVYLNIRPGNKRIAKRVNRKTRGLGKTEINFAKLRKAWLTNKNRFSIVEKVKIRRFMGLQYCLHTNNMQNWRKWIEVEKEMKVEPSPYAYRTYPRSKDGDKLSIRLRGVSCAGRMSEPYVTKGEEREVDDSDAQTLHMLLDQPDFID